MAKYNNTRVKNPYPYHFIEMEHPNIGKQQQKMGERLAILMNKYRFNGSSAAKFANIIAGTYGFRVTPSDINNYLHGVSPKTDKLYALAKAFGVKIEYLCGYGKK